MNDLVSKIKCFKFPYIYSNMYILLEGRKALVIDPVVSNEGIQYLEGKRVEHITMLLTHEHFDHTNGIPLFRKKYASFLICQKEAIDKKRQKHFNRPMLVTLLLLQDNREAEAKKMDEEFLPYSYGADAVYNQEYEIIWEGHYIRMVHAPGHSPASNLIFLDEKVCFTGDSLIPNNMPTLKWPWSNQELFYQKTNEMLLKIEPDICILPGHGDGIKREKLIYQGKYFVADTGGRHVDC